MGALKTRDGEPSIVGTFRDPQSISARLRKASEEYHLVSPATSVGQLPEGCGVATTLVHIDVDRETYGVGDGKRGLDKPSLNRIAAGLGLSWSPVYSRRLDNGRHPHYCHYVAVGTYRAFDGQTQWIKGEKELDLRDGSPLSGSLKEKQLQQMREHILAHAETKAQLRAIRSLGIQTSYTVEELKRPFLVARIMFTGETDDPELRREFAKMTAQSFMGGSAALYGDSAPALPQAAPQEPQGHAPPPVGSVADDDFIDAPSEPAPASPPPQQSERKAPASSGALTIPGGKAKGTPLPDASDRDLQYWANRIGKELDEGTAKYPEKDKKMHAALLDEIAKREGSSAGAAEEEPSFNDDEIPY